MYSLQTLWLLTQLVVSKQGCSDIGFVHVNGARLWMQHACFKTHQHYTVAENTMKTATSHKTVVWNRSAQISVSFTSTATSSGSNMCALKPHHHCTVAENTMKTATSHKTVVWNKSAQISVSFTSTATSSGSNMCALKPHHHCTVAENLINTLTAYTTVVWIKNTQTSVSCTSTAPASGSNMRALKPHHPCTVAENLHQNSNCSRKCDLNFNVFVHVNNDLLWI